MPFHNGFGLRTEVIMGHLISDHFKITVCLKDNHETKNGAAVLSNGIFEDNLSKRYITEIKIFC